METSYNIHIIPGEEPIEYSFPQDTPFCNCFNINFCYTCVVQLSQSEMPITTSFNQPLLIPCDLLCDCEELGVTSILHGTFSSISIPSDVLVSFLPQIGACARDMIAHNSEGSRILQMDVNVTVRVTTRPSEDADIVNHHASMATLVNSLERVRIDDASSCSTERCAICLEEFCHGSESKLNVRTQCSHVFHEQCILRWLQYSNTSQSCPLCRHQMTC